MIYVGIDNGADGGVCALSASGAVLGAEPAPTINLSSLGKKRVPNTSRMAYLLRELCKLDDVFVVLEKAQAFPREGAVTSFNYGCGYGVWQGILAALCIEHVIVVPKDWQGVMLRGVEGEDTKAKSVLKAQRTLPSLQLVQPRSRTPHDGVADAACMALYAMHLKRTA